MKVKGEILLFLPNVQRPADSRTASLAPGTKLQGRVPGVHWQQTDRTLVLAISSHCHFCTESAPFFRRLYDEVGNKVKLVALVQETPNEAQQYLAGEGVVVDDIHQVSFVAVGIRGTPALLLVDRAGVVVRVWVAKLDSKEQDQVLNALRG